MAIELNCPSCHTRMRVDDTAASKKARCPQCQAICEIPSLAASLLAPLSPLPESPLSPLTPLGHSIPSSPLDPPARSDLEPKPNPFSETNSYGGAVQTPLNPYASPVHHGPSINVPLTSDQLRMKLLGPAIGIVVGGLFCLGYATFNAFLLATGAIQMPPEAANDPGYSIGWYFGATVIFLPSLAMLVASIALFLGKPRWLAWVSVISAVLPCNPCCFISLGFGVWGIVMLCDPRVSRAMQ